MARMTRPEALSLCNRFRIDPKIDWHVMHSDMKESVLAAADAHKYRKPKNANGSRGRYFAAYLSRAIERRFE